MALPRARHIQPRKPFYTLFWAKIEKTPTCWLWTASDNGVGYGKIKDQTTGKYRLAHRVSYEMFRGPIPEGLILDHLCRNRRCVNPSHLEPVTQAENLRRARSHKAP